MTASDAMLFQATFDDLCLDMSSQSIGQSRSSFPVSCKHKPRTHLVEYPIFLFNLRVAAANVFPGVENMGGIHKVKTAPANCTGDASTKAMEVDEPTPPSFGGKEKSRKRLREWVSSSTNLPT
ncbi:unnamed protein product [Eruca vesicaria subsp. sativa]|uniref:Uncharacterized protein n=1 Tax=Eruca vesicaria subsp. sativa TaxID=29727 RepID=A0ABC8M6W2_ERUVS|nr:unnamed protein product [Eruca vesicaria subsp. sativa]